MSSNNIELPSVCPWCKKTMYSYMEMQVFRQKSLLVYCNHCTNKYVIEWSVQVKEYELKEVHKNEQ